ncbi:MAG: heme exporter protein CcmD, partial [Casimicrobiaceae bacterium]
RARLRLGRLADRHRSIAVMSFLAMGGYAWYVWMAYGVVAAAIVAEIVALKRRSRRAFEVARMVQQAGDTDGLGLQVTGTGRAR